MAKRMLIDATHPEETRVVVVDGTRLEELDVETSTKKQLKGNIYLARVIRVEPSLQAAFVEYGGNRHGFLAFGEIHPDYFQIPEAEREALLAEERRADALREESETDDIEILDHPPEVNVEDLHQIGDEQIALEQAAALASTQAQSVEAAGEPALLAHSEEAGFSISETVPSEHPLAPPVIPPLSASEPSQEAFFSVQGTDNEVGLVEIAPPSSLSDAPSAAFDLLSDADGEEAKPRPKSLRHYKIQDVIKRRQIMLVQVVKEERGNKGAALTTYLSLAGRYCVLMPNTVRGGGVSRKITNIADRRRLKAITSELEVSEGMAMIVRTAGQERSKAEIKRDYDYLLRAWESVRTLSLQSVAPALVYEEASLIKRAVRDVYSSDIDEILVEGEDGYRLAKDYMGMLTPDHARRVQPYRDPTIPLFHRFQVENQLDAMHSPVVQLKSGGYIVISPTEALVAIDVNSGRATKERHIEETAFKTNLEAAEEIARQLRLRDLAGLIVIDFIDMEDNRNNAAVERKLKEAMKTDRARIQLGRISPFGLLELSRQRLRPSLQETSFQPCTHCGGTGIVRSVESTSVYILRALEDEGIKQRASEITITVPTNVALYILNHKREKLADIEKRYRLKVYLAGDDALIPPDYRIERIKTDDRIEDLSVRPLPNLIVPREEPKVQDDRTNAHMVEAENFSESDENGEEDSQGQRRKRRRRRRRRSGEQGEDLSANGVSENADDQTDQDGALDNDSDETADSSEDGEGVKIAEGERKSRRRGRRGGRRKDRRDAESPSHDFQVIEDSESFVVQDTFAPVSLDSLPSSEAPETVAAEEVNHIEDAPAKKPAARRRKKVSEPVEGDENVLSTDDQPVTKEKRKAPSRRSKKLPETETPNAEAQGVEDSSARQDMPAVIEQNIPSEPKGDIVAVIGMSSPESIVVSPPPAAEAEEPSGPPRQGWWNRKA